MKGTSTSYTVITKTKTTTVKGKEKKIQERHIKQFMRDNPEFVKAFNQARARLKRN